MTNQNLSVNIPRVQKLLLILLRLLITPFLVLFYILRRFVSGLVEAGVVHVDANSHQQGDFDD
jgi:hypothetical protein